MVIALTSPAMPFRFSLRLFLAALFLLPIYGCAFTEGGTSTPSAQNSTTTNSGNGIVLSDTFGQNPTVAAAVVDDHVNVYVAWEEPSGFLIFRRSTNGGQSFEPPQRLFSVIPEGSHPVLAASGDNVFLVWTGDGTQQRSREILFSLSNQQGRPGSFNPTPILVSDLGRLAIHPALTVSPFDNIYISWLDGGSGDLFFRRSLFLGQGFEDTRNLSVNLTQNLSEHGVAKEGISISADEGNVYVAWEDTLPDNPNDNLANDILFLKSTDAGQTFGNPANLSQNLSNSRHPVTTIANGKLYIAWEDFSSTANGSVGSVLVFQRSLNQGDTFINRREFNLFGVFTEPNQGPKMAADGEKVFIVWPDRAPDPTDSSQGSLQVFFTQSSNQGQTFVQPLNISENPISSKNPAVAAAKGEAFAVWEGQSGIGDNATQKIFFYKPIIPTPSTLQ